MQFGRHSTIQNLIVGSLIKDVVSLLDEVMLLHPVTLCAVAPRYNLFYAEVVYDIFKVTARKQCPPKVAQLVLLRQLLGRTS